MDAVAVGGGQSFGLPCQRLGELLGMLGVVSEAEAVLV
jgi:hypothetical protein